MRSVAAAWPVLPQEPQARGGADQQSLKGSGCGEQNQTESEDQSVALRLCSQKARQSTVDQRARGCGKGATPIAVPPTSDNVGMRRGQQASEQSPTPGQPTLQHPHDCAASGRNGDPRADDRVTGDGLTERQHEALGRQIL